MSCAEVRAALRSTAPRVLVEAPAGTGKTYEAAHAALDLAEGIRPSQEVLVLAHTHAAVQAFRERFGRVPGARVRAMTLDSLAYEVVEPYAGCLGLPCPLHLGGENGVKFSVLAEKFVELLHRAPAVGRALGQHYPFVILDEHQDASRNQHRAITGLASCGGSRLRFLGDPMQSIYGWKGGTDLIAWDDLVAEVGAAVALDEPHRWRETRDLGEWMLASRETLAALKPLRISGAPPCVKSWAIAAPIRQGGGAIPPTLPKVMWSILRGIKGTVVVLCRHRHHVRSLHRRLGRGLRAFEGMDVEEAYGFLAKAEAAGGDPRALARIVMQLVKKTCSGLDRPRESAIEKSLGETRVDRGKRVTVGPFLAAIEILYSEPSTSGFCRAIAALVTARPSWLRIELPLALSLLARQGGLSSADVRAGLDQTRQARAASIRLPARSISTIHKSKGHEADYVVLASCGNDDFPETVEGSRLLYVALSRARKGVHLLAPAAGVSPLLQF